LWTAAFITYITLLMWNDDFVPGEIPAVSGLITVLLLIWMVVSSNTNFSKETTKQFPVFIIDEHAIIFDNEEPIRVDHLKQFKEGDIVIKRTLGPEWIYGIYWEEESKYECCLGDSIEN